MDLEKELHKWIAVKKTATWKLLHECGRHDEEWDRARGASDILDELYLYLLYLTNPHNRDDINKQKMERLDSNQPK